jgi:hypothetical protein
MTTGVTSLTGFDENPYITVAEFKNAPTSIDYNNLVVNGNQQAQDAELARVIMRATSYLNEYLNQDLVASQTTETQRVRMNNQGYIALHPNVNPILSLESFYYGTTPNNLQALTDPSQCWFENQQVIVPLSQFQTTYSSQGPLAFGPAGVPGQVIYTKYTYVGGYVNTLCAGTALATTLVVTDASGIIPGERYHIYDGANSEIVVVSPNYVYGNTTVTLSTPLAYTHAAVAFSNMPTALKQAAILMTTVFIRARGDSSMTMNLTTQPTANIANNQRYSGSVALALDMVSKYRRVR